ncbi:hypothetical protein CAPTEDRAFT_98393, partial [Capitella teleta]
RIHIVTWNVADEGPPDDFTRLLKLDSKVLPNIYAIGLQEMNASTGAMITDSIYEDQWTKSLSECLCQRNYVRVKSVRMMGIMLFVFVRRIDLLYVSNIESEFARTGFGGLWGNKGGVSVRMAVSGVNICFVNCHLAAHLPNVSDRIADYDDIIDTHKFRDEEVDCIMDHDYVFWMGDLNFRLDEISRDEVVKRVQNNDLESLYQYDQLKKAMAEEVILVDFQEGPLTFPPSYKFDKKTNVYDTSSKKRKPGWCDRILWMVHPDTFEDVPLSVRQVAYSSIPEYTDSDHKPVIAEFVIQVLHHPTELPILFEPQDVWCTFKSNKCCYTIVSEQLAVGPWDWIGLFKYDFKHPKDYQTYSWAAQKGDDLHDGTLMYEISFEDHAIKHLEAGLYCLCYFSYRKNCLMGYSDCFRVSAGLLTS